MSSALRRYLITEHVIAGAVVNFFLNALIAWLSFRHLRAVPLWGQQSIGGDLIGTTILLPLLTCLIVTRIVGVHLRHRRLDAAEIGRGAREWLMKLPNGVMLRGLALGAVTTLVTAPVLLLLLASADVENMELGRFLLFKASYAAMLAAMVQPIVAMRAILDGMS